MNELVRYEEIQQIGAVLAKSGYFTDAKSEAQAIVKVLAGREIGIGAVASMSGIHIIQGKPAIGATLMAAMVKRAGKYDYKVLEMSDTECSIEFFQDSKSIGVSTFTAADAKRAGTQNMGKFPRNMLFARAMSNGVKWYTPDVFTGPIYEPGELGANVDYETGEIIDGVYEVAEPQGATLDGQQEQYETPDNTAVMPPEQLIEYLRDESRKLHSKYNDSEPTPEQSKALVAAMNQVAGGDSDRRHTFYYAIYPPAKSNNDLSKRQTVTLLNWINSQQDENGEWYIGNPNAVEEFNRVVTAAIGENAVGDLFGQEAA